MCAKDFLRRHLPDEVVPLLADESPELVDGTFINENLRDRQGDVLFRVKLKSGEHLFVYVILESGPDVEPRMPLLVMRYKLRIWDYEMDVLGAKPGKLTPILPLVVYHGKEPWTAHSSISEMIAGDPALRSEM